MKYGLYLMDTYQGLGWTIEFTIVRIGFSVSEAKRYKYILQILDKVHFIKSVYGCQMFTEFYI